jgi:hypothetical protein
VTTAGAFALEILVEESPDSGTRLGKDSWEEEGTLLSRFSLQLDLGITALHGDKLCSWPREGPKGASSELAVARGQKASRQKKPV